MTKSMALENTSGLIADNTSAIGKTENNTALENTLSTVVSKSETG
jgi:hypothetical protein